MKERRSGVLLLCAVLTGCWRVNERPLCTSDLHSHAELDVLEPGRVEALPWRIRQSGADLEVTDLESGLEFSGTVSGDRVRYGHRETVSGLEAAFEMVFEGVGVVTSADVILVEETYAFSSAGAALGVVCELRLERLAGVPAGCVAGSGDE